MTDFIGAKAAFFCGTQVLTYLRDDFAHLPWPGRWDLPGGGREGEETPEACLLRELQEEFGLTLPEERLELRLDLPAFDNPDVLSIFFGGTLTEAEIALIRFGDEGQRWQLMDVADYVIREDAVPWLQERVLLAWPSFQPANHAAR